MNYRHAFHAGNFADVWKHTVLLGLLDAMGRKDKPFMYLETHAGVGDYRLGEGEAERTGEYLEGIGRLWRTQAAPPLLQRYLDLIHSSNADGELVRYPGSPRIARSALRERDRAVLCELHPEDAQRLQRRFANDSRVTVVEGDGYAAIKRFLPPIEKRGLVLIDPPFEKDDYSASLEAVKQGVQRFATGVYAIWYPIKARQDIDRWHAAWRRTGLRKLLRLELCIARDDNPMRLNGSGMLILNPPYQLAEELKAAGEHLLKALSIEEGARLNIDWVVPE